MKRKHPALSKLPQNEFGLLRQCHHRERKRRNSGKKARNGAEGRGIAPPVVGDIDDVAVGQLWNFSAFFHQILQIDRDSIQLTAPADFNSVKFRVIGVTARVQDREKKIGPFRVIMHALLRNRAEHHHANQNFSVTRPMDKLARAGRKRRRDLSQLVVHRFGAEGRRRHEQTGAHSPDQ